MNRTYKERENEEQKKRYHQNKETKILASVLFKLVWISVMNYFYLQNTVCNFNFTPISSSLINFC